LYRLPPRASRRSSRSTTQVCFETFRLPFRNDPRQNSLHCREAWNIRLSNDRKQLKPQIIVGMFDEFANRTGDKIGHGHRRCGGAALEPSRYARIQRRQDAGRDIGPINLCDEFSEHGASVLQAYSLGDRNSRATRHRGSLDERNRRCIEIGPLNIGLSRENADVLPQRLFFDHSAQALGNIVAHDVEWEICPGGFNRSAQHLLI
jgi:hypothetical protein